MSYIQNTITWKEKEMLEFYKTVYKDGMTAEDLSSSLVADGIEKYQTITSAVMGGAAPCPV